MKKIGRGKKLLQQNIFDRFLAFQLIQTDEVFTANGRKHIYLHMSVLYILRYRHILGQKAIQEKSTHIDTFWS